MLVDPERIGSTLPFGYYVEREPDVLLLRRPDDTLVAAFSARGVDSFEVELTVWEDAD
jgi:hypothetical protein